MALFKPILGQISGKIAGNVFAHNKAGAYIRQHVVPTNPNTPLQAVYRAMMSAITSRWQTVVTIEQKAAWASYAANTPVNNRMGDQIFLDALNWYLATNVLSFSSLATYIDDAPTVFGLTSLSPVTGDVAVGTQDAGVNFVDGEDWALSDGGVLFVSQGKPVGAGVNFFRGPYRPTAFILGDSILPPTSPETVASLSFPAVTGQRSYWRIRAMDATGRLSAPQFVEFTVT